MPEPACVQPETCWEGGLFHFAIEFPQGYPFKPFKLWLETKMYHPNVSVQGEGEGESPAAGRGAAGCAYTALTPDAQGSSSRLKAQGSCT